MSSKLLEVKNLKTSFFTPEGEVKAVSGVSYYVDQKEIIAIVGESGCGKSVTQMSVMQLIQTPPGKILEGEVFFEGEDLLKYHSKSKQMLSVRGSGISMIFQEPMTSLNPVLTVGYQLTEMIMTHKKVNKEEANKQALQLLNDVGIPEAKRRLKEYPFQMSGGMRQRVMIALAISCNPKLIIADEPTTALDVTTQAQIMEKLMSLVRERNTALIIITHNLGLVARYAERIYVMYGGRIIESGTAEDILKNPVHPYTNGLLASVPKLDQSRSQELIPIPGAPPKLINLPDSCNFMPRCKFACEKCKKSKAPELHCIDGKMHFVACHVKGVDN
ncbi:MAG TPA: peptide ABC transporter ATP-binding protein [Sphaerochaeta sp.]|nr:peptide ABC transporter ATP-binding protein [Sphaerochaeta sp.]